MPAPITIPFPRSSQPGQRPGEGAGRLVNTFCEVDGDLVRWPAVPGLVAFGDMLRSTPRGATDIGGVLYAAYSNVVLSVSSSGTPTLLSGALSGDGPVTWSRNNKASSPDVVVVSEQGAFTVTPTTVSSFADPDLPQPNSVSPLGGYHVFTIGDGRIFTTGLNTITVDALAFATAESNPDGLIRGVTHGNVFFAMGTDSIEIWRNAGTSPFPLARDSSTIPVGLLGPWAVAGQDNGWDGPLIFVAADGTVRVLNGYTPDIISNKDVERDIAKISDKTTIRASVYVVGGNPIFSLQSPSWTWEYNVRTGFWHERQSYGALRWRGSTSVKFAGKWLIGDVQSTKLQEVSEAAYTEDGAALVTRWEAGPVKQFPDRTQVPAAFFDFTTGQGSILGSDDEVTPKASVSWSHDGGATWSVPITARLLGQQGQFDTLVRVNRMGLSTHHGIRIAIESSSPVYRVLRGGRMDAQLRRAA
jgi:hypothetical protein